MTREASLTNTTRISVAIANTIFGGTAEYVALWFKSQKLESGFYIYVSAMMFVALLIALRIRNTNATSLIEDD